MFNLKSNSVKKYDRSMPRVQFENKQIEFNLLSIFSVNRNIYEYLGLLLLRLGFEPEDNIMLCNFDKENRSFDCIVDKKENYKIKINADCTEITVSIFNNEYGYECIPLEYSEIGMRVSLGRYSIKYPDGMTFTRCLSRKNAKFIIELYEYIIELELEKPNDINLPLFDENGCYAKYKLDSEEELVKYITLIGANINVVEIYKKLCESYLGDVSVYPKFMLRKSKKIDGELKVTDMIWLKAGKLEQFGMTNYDRTVFLDKDDNWSYKMPMEGSLPVSFSLSFHDGEKSCVFSSFEDDEFMMNYIGGNIKNDIGIAMNEVAYARKRVLEIFGNNQGSN